MQHMNRLPLIFACSLLLIAQAGAKEKSPPPKPAATQAATAAEQPQAEKPGMSCKGCKAATDSLKSARAAAKAALDAGDKDQLKAALLRADAQMARMEGHKEKCMAMMKDAKPADTAAGTPIPAGHEQHH